MTWDGFIAIVFEHLGVDATRRGIDALRMRAARNAVVDLQRFIEGFRKNQVTAYTTDQLVLTTEAHLGQLPSGAKPRAFYVYQTTSEDNPDIDPNCRRNRLRYLDWKYRQQIICCRDDCTYVYSIAPTGRSFLVHPLITADTRLLLIWDGFKSDFIGGDVVVFPEEAAEAVAAYVKWRILLEVDKNVLLAREMYGIYVMKRLALYRDFQETLSAEQRASEYFADSLAPAQLPDFGSDFDPGDFNTVTPP